MVLRIGLHIGEVSEMEEQITGDTRAVGMAINLCARIMDLAEDGQILLTRGVFGAPAMAEYQEALSFYQGLRSQAK